MFNTIENNQGSEVISGSVDKVELRKMLPISLTFDHRAVTGGEAARFLEALIKTLEKVS